MNTPLSTDDSAIVLEDATKSYGRAVAVKSVTLEVPRSCVFGLIGPNGAGKTTLIKMAMGLLRMTSGRASVLGRDASTEADAIHRLVGYVPEVPTVYRWMKVAEVIGLCRSFRDTWNDDLCGELLDTFSLDPAKKVKQLSKGMLTKLSLLLATAYEPEVLILDEPTSGLDAVIREEFLDSVLKVICQRECTVLFSSHAIEDVERIADRVGILLDGRLHVDAPVDESLEGLQAESSCPAGGRAIDPRSLPIDWEGSFGCVDD
jgi:ABC-2 type transport system ATP-binding protein